MSNRLSVLMTVYNEIDFIDHAIKSCLPYVDCLTIVEGSYLESQKIGATPRSSDGTLKIVEKYAKAHDKITLILTNEQTDKDQRNVGLAKIKEINPDGWLHIQDGDEVYTKENFIMIRNFMATMEKQNKYAAYFKSLTFVNDFEHFVDQEFPRLFKITPECEFVADNYMHWPDKGLKWGSPHVIKIPYLSYHHYAFCKSDKKRFQLKKDWWNSRFGKEAKFEYDWYVNEKDQIWSPNHTIRQYTGRHPKIMKSHPMWKESVENEA